MNLYASIRDSVIDFCWFKRKGLCVLIFVGVLIMIILL